MVKTVNPFYFSTAITRAQRIALKRKFDVCPLYARLPYRDKDNRLITDDVTSNKQWDMQEPLTYRQFRKRVKYGIDCIMVQWCGMWLGIELDGFTHS